MNPKRIIGIIDYGVGNLASVVHALRAMGYRCCVRRDHDELAESDLLLVPGVGAFPQAMDALHRLDLVQFIQNQAYAKKPIVGICLGMGFFLWVKNQKSSGYVSVQVPVYVSG